MKHPNKLSENQQRLYTELKQFVWEASRPAPHKKMEDYIQELKQILGKIADDEK